MSGMRFGVLGPLVAAAGGVPVDLKGPRHRAVLARLLIARGRAVSRDVLIDDLWADPPDSAVGTVQTFVSDLRRALEPDRPPRAPASLLVTAGPGYALRAGPDAVDAWSFEAELHAARDLAANTALTRLDEALSRWRGPAYADVAAEEWAFGEINRLTGLRLLAVERRAEAALALGRAAEVAADLDAHVTAHPHREDAWRLLALALYRTGRQADALAVLRRARDLLDRELALDPGPELRRLESDILRQAAHLLPPPEPVAKPFFGRAGELAALDRAAETARRGESALALVSGAAGAGKSALAGALAVRLGARGWHTVTDHELPRGDGRIDRFRAYSADLARRAADGPVLAVFDDLQWADEEITGLLGWLATDRPRLPVLLLGLYRGTEVGAPLAAALARIARTEPTRVYLGGLERERIGELVRATAEREAGPDAVRIIAERSGGNPFYVRELARLFDAEGPGALTEVPPGVRDVIRHRLLALPEPARTVLGQAAVLGQDVPLDLLFPLAGADETALAAVEAATRAGFVTEAGPHRIAFDHTLVREAIYDGLSQSRRARLHGEIALLLEDLRPDDVAALAHHHLRAQDPKTAAKAVHYAGEAARRAEARFAPHEAAGLWRAAVDAGDDSLETLMGLGRALAVTGDLAGARARRSQALTAALGDPVAEARAVGAFAVPALWTRNDDPELSARVVEIAERALPAAPPADRSRLLSTIALELRGCASPRGRDAAGEAETIARRLADPALLVLALNARYLHSFDGAGGASRRAEIGAELVATAAEHGLVPFEVLGHLVLLQSHAAHARLAAADRHAEAADRLAERHEIPLVGVFTDWYRALRLALTGAPAEAEAAYRRAAARLPGTGMTGLVEEDPLDLALRCLRVRNGELEAAVPFPDPSPGLLYEARVAMTAVHALRTGDRETQRRCRAALAPAEGELAGAGSGMLTLGPVADLLAALDVRA